MRKHLIVILAALLFTATASAQKAPNIALGFQPDSVFHLGEIDSVNLFNGNVIMRLPIGPEYRVGGQLSYRFQIVGNSTAWDFIDNSSPACEGCKYAYPNQRGNAGTGWRLSLGRLISPADPGADFGGDPMWLYESPAGDEHAFGIPYQSPVVAYDPSYPDTILTAADSSALRMVKDGTRRIVEFPNGERHTFELGIGVEEWRLTQIDDRFGNYVRVTYTDQSGRVVKWTVDDSAGRRHIVDFIHSDLLNSTDFQGQIVERVQLGALTSEATPQPRATYTFEYEDVDVAWPCSHKLATNDQPGNYPPVRRTLLKRITLPAPDSSTFEFTHHTTANCYSAGAIATVTLPTKGTYSYTYTSSGLPVGGLCGGSLTFPGTPVILSKTVTTRDTSSTWDYKQSLGKEHEPTTDELEATCRKCEGVAQCGPTKRLTFIWTPPRRWSHMTVLEPEVNSARVRRDHFFSLWQGRMSTPELPNQLVLEDQAFGAHNIRYGLPITAATPAHGTGCDQLNEECADTEGSVGDGALLSTRMFRMCSGAIGTCSATDLLRSNYLRYSWYTFGYETDRSRTVFNDDTACSNASCWTETRFSSENGAGRFSETQLWSNFTTAAGSMTSRNTTAYPTWASVTDRLDRNKKWILDVFTEKTHTENSVTAKTEYHFDDDGNLLGMRVWKDTTGRGPNDVLTIFGYDANRNLVQEKRYGGDLQALNTDSCCYAPSPDKPRYLIRNTYTHAMLSKSEYLDRDSCTDISQAGCESILVTSDYDVDQRSGQITKSRDSAGVETTYQYDTAFRLTDVTPAGSAASSYSYSAATATSNAQVVEIVKDGSTELMKSTYEFDGLGRVKRVSKSIPSNPDSATCGAAADCFAVTQTDYDALGRKSRTSQPVEATSHPTSNVGTDWTTTTYDAHGRPVSVTSPDNQTITFSYTGVREMSRTSSVATSATGSTNAITIERYDVRGRLAEVEESSGDTRATRTTGDQLTAAYTYDVGGRLATVQMTHGAKIQNRAFNYDLRGFLSTETHPENGTTTYSSYDARGHATKKVEGGVELNYTFDSAERLTKVFSAAGKTLKDFKFDTENVNTDLRKGKLYEAFRDDTRTLGGGWTVTESYEYKTASGQLSKQTTTVRKDGVIVQDSETAIEYDPLRFAKKITMPTCSANGCTAANGLAFFEYGRTKGLLTSVGSYGTLTYHPSWLANKITHGSSPTSIDTYEVTDGLPRPSKITFGGGCPGIAAPTISASDSICAGASGSASVSASQGITHTWTITGGTPASATGEQMTFAAGTSGAVTLTVTARSTCGATATSSKTISITSAPTATLTTGPATIDRGSSVMLSVALTGPAPRTIVWSDGVTESGIEQSTWTRTVNPTTTTSYTIASVTSGGCTGTASGATTVTVIPPAPAFVNASTQSNRTVLVTWAAIASPVDGYEVERRTHLNGIGTIVATTTGTAVIDTVPASDAPVSYVYYVRSIAANTRSNYDRYDHATCATTLYQQPQLLPGVTMIRAADFAELRSAVDSLRFAFGLPAGSYSPTAVIRASDIAEIVHALNAVRLFMGAPPLGSPPNPGDIVRAVHIEQLREALR